MRHFFNHSHPLRAMLATVGALLLAVFGLTAPAQATTADPYANVNQSVVYVQVNFATQVTVPMADGKTSPYTVNVFMRCSGSVISSVGHILTAAHCLEPSEDVAKVAREEVKKYFENQGYDMAEVEYKAWNVQFGKTPSVSVSQPQAMRQQVFQGEGMLQARIVASQTFETGDNALLQIPNVSGMVPLTLASSVPAVGEVVKSFGFPGITDTATSTQRQDPTFRTLTITRHTATAGNATPILEVDGEILSGMSGGPALNANYEVVGVNSSGYTSMSVSYVTNTEMMTTFLRNSGVDVSTGTPARPPVGDDNPPTAPVVVAPSPATAGTSGGVVGWVLGGVGVLVVGAVVYWRMRAPKSATKPTGRRAAHK